MQVLALENIKPRPMDLPPNPKSFAKRVDIWRDQCDRQSLKYFCQMRNFLGKCREIEYILSSFNAECVINFSSLHIIHKFMCFFYTKCVICAPYVSMGLLGGLLSQILVAA